ncbi:MAG: flagellar filament capping protein FliD [Fibrobacterota bacterium]
MSTTSSGISVGGLVSGIDTNSLVDQLTSLEQQKVAAVTKKQNQAQLRLSALGSLQSQLTTLSSKASSLSKLDSFSLFKSTSSDESIATIDGSGEGLQGNIGVNVRQLATSWKVASKAMTDSISSVAASGTLSLSKSAAALKTDSSKTTVDITIAEGDTLKDIASKINAASGAGMTATIVNFGTGDTRLMLNGVDEGGSSFSITENAEGTVMSALGLNTSGTSTATSDFNLRLAAGGPAIGTSTLGSLYTGIGANNIAADDSISFSWTQNGSASTDTISAATFSKASLADVTVDEITAYMTTAMGAGVSVSLDPSGRMIATDTTGGNLAFSMEMGEGSAGTLALGSSTSQPTWANVLQQGKDAFYSMNGLSMVSKTNTDTTTLNGATIKLRQVSETTTDQTILTLNRDTAAIQKSVQDFLDSFNSVIKYIDENSTSTVTSTKDENGMTQNKVIPGDLSFDSSVRGIKTQLRTMLTSQVKELAGKTNYDSLASVGITTSKDDGKLTIDQTKFQAALSADFDGLRRLFSNSGWTDNGSATVGGWNDSTKPGTYTVTPSTDTIAGNAGNRIGDILFSQTGDSKGMGVTAPTSITGDVKATFARGVAGQLQSYIKTLTAFDGAYKSNTNSVSKQIADYTKDATKVQDRVDTYRKNLVAQFSAMETAMMKIKNQSSAFMAQIGG